ncbi:hydroxymethylglutaryl-CoA synthase family protein [Flavobacterium caeni]|uniref:Hydroxymethylglutaryl-CoA synthase n=1 Tax=Flavobacterium caeni TaxID=490189 RepID=A0A1G5H2T4_9FLAO|nr:hydroxymethylglutaryl-CoA synthase [Flavobacterium caeni]SCY58044.1 hydroxymethylglutaryl-CoA synthase [Flavobacterium caeni]
MKIGIDALAFNVASLHLPIAVLAEKRNIDPEKLEKGLGLLKMTFPDVHQDSVVFAANALTKLVEEHRIDLTQICRIYVGSESGIDNSKPIASYLSALMEQKYGDGLLQNCDVVDFTFACIGGVDALQNCFDFVRLNPDAQTIVVTTDRAKYDLGSGGEYTQGAGAVAMLVKANPRIIAFDTHWATDTKGLFDFFKPYRTISKTEITGSDQNPEWLGQLEQQIEIHKDQPVFDGQYSNQCYMDRTRGAYFSLKKQLGFQGTLYDSWENIIMHLPYAFQGRRMLSEIFALDSDGKIDTSDLKSVAKSDAYQKFVAQKLAPAEKASSLVGNLYTGSIFMALLSALSVALENQSVLEGKTFGFLAYGSGSKSKVFQGEVQTSWREAIAPVNLFETLAKSQELNFETYEKLHKKEQQTGVKNPKSEWVLDRIENDNPVLMGARYYKWID